MGYWPIEWSGKRRDMESNCIRGLDLVGVDSGRIRTNFMIIEEYSRVTSNGRQGKRREKRPYESSIRVREDLRRVFQTTTALALSKVLKGKIRKPNISQSILLGENHIASNYCRSLFDFMTYQLRRLRCRIHFNRPFLCFSSA